ncbi:NB-ARC domain-containing protein [Amycolatopsis lurida]|uniref:AfsR family regulator n=1 Tax=Amycolatopsis lurida NRRL 2430 TaxID=1460371 RepID=A0A2P2FK59_AMYLU|nr:NB-ARC domain-containing protein [Amycolatopsis lurida]KFU77110.1 AfsR family regulator [Amycolatopsis lurida NRRL 2430]SEC51403.1 NB-ARC domain-containing protein [Amycolatopsis lurida]
MGRPERPLDGSTGPIAAFAHDLRVLRNRAGNPSYRELARTALFAPSVLSSAASGHRLPTLAVTLAFVSACGGDRAVWERRWRSVAGQPGAGAETREDRAADTPPDGAHATASGVIRLARPAQLPMGSRIFVGRERDLADAAEMIGASGPVKVPLLVSGPIGVGKTAFALRLAEEVAADFPDGQLYADLGDSGSGGRSANGIVRGFLRALGVPAHLVPDDPMQRIGLYRSLLAERRLFVLLTGVRDEGQVRPLLGQAPHSQVVVTSRARLLGLEDTNRIELDTFSRKESLALIGRIAGPGRVRAEHDATDTIAELCGDLPLAVNIVGRKIAARPEWAIAYTAGQLADRERLMGSLCVGDVNVRDRFSAAYDHLSPTEREAVQHFGQSGAGWTTSIGVAAAMGIMIETADELLESVVDAGLLQRANVAGRYAVSRLVSAFAAERQREPGPFAAAVSMAGRRTRKNAFESLRHEAVRTLPGGSSEG